MSKIIIDFFDTEAEITDFEKGRANVLEIVFPDDVDGFISIDSIVAKVTRGKCVIDPRLFDNGKYTPMLIRAGSNTPLPTILKTQDGVFPAESGSEYIRKISNRERELEKRVKALEQTLEKIYKSVYGTSIF